MSVVGKSEKVYAVKDVVSIRYSEEKRQFQFEVRWVPTKKFKKPQNSWLPIDELITCPKFLLDFEKKQYEQWMRTCDEFQDDIRFAHLSSKCWKAPLAAGPVKPFLANEYELTGRERLAKIYYDVTHFMDDGTTQIYYTVRFTRFSMWGSEYFIVQKPYLEYYFPAKLALYLYTRSVATENADEEPKEVVSTKMKKKCLTKKKLKMTTRKIVKEKTVGRKNARMLRSRK